MRTMGGVRVRMVRRMILKREIKGVRNTGGIIVAMMGVGMMGVSKVGG